MQIAPVAPQDSRLSRSFHTRAVSFGFFETGLNEAFVACSKWPNVKSLALQRFREHQHSPA